MEYKAPFILPWVVLGGQPEAGAQQQEQQQQPFIPFTTGPDGDYSQALQLSPLCPNACPGCKAAGSSDA